jgi:hypothetical protein
MSQDVGRSLKAPLSDGTPDMELPTAAQRANSFLAFDANGLPTAITAGTSGAPTTITRQVFSGTGSQTVFTLASDPGALGNSAQVYIGGVYQQRSTYTILGTTLTFSAAPVAGTDNIEFINFLTSSIGATSADLVTYTPAGAGAVARSAASKFGDTVSVKDFGAVGDGVADDAQAIQTAIVAAIGKTLYFPSGTYRIAASPSNNAAGIQIGTTLTANSRWVGDSATFVCDASSHRSHMVYMNCGSGFAFEIAGIAFNAATKSLNCVRIDSSNFSSSFVAIGCTFENTLALDATGVGGYVATAGLRTVGAFASATVSRCIARNIDRVAGASIPGSAGSSGISIGPTGSNYALFASVTDCRIENVTCQDTGSSATNVDCDGLFVGGQPANLTALYTPARATISGNSFVNCKGRDIKAQTDEATISGNTSYRNILPISGGFAAINVQLCAGIIANNILHFDEVPGTPNLSPFTANGSTTPESYVLAAYQGATTVRARCITITGNTVFNNVSAPIGVLGSIVITSEGAATPSSPLYATVSSNIMSGGTCQYFATVALRSASDAPAYHTICDNFISSITTAFMAGSATSPPFNKNFFALHGNRHNSAAVRHLVNVSSPTTYYTANVSAFNNTNINLADDSAGGYPAERNRPNAIISRIQPVGDPETNEGGIMSVQSVVVADDATYAFPYRGYVGYGSVRILTGSTGDNASCVFRHGSSTTTSISAGANVSLGTSSNPDVDGNVNIWSSSADIISIKNRLGSSRTFTLYTFG